MYRSICVAVVLLSIASFNSQASDNLVDQIQRCSQIDSNDVRLACYDEIAQSASSVEPTSEAAPHSQQPGSGPKVIVAAPEPAAAVPSIQAIEDQFGFEQQQTAAAEEEVDRIYVEVSEIQGSRTAPLTIYLVNGQVWRQIGTDRFFYNESQGKAYVERGSMSSFFFSQDETKRRIRVKRLR